jgi:hypothetical protein
MKIVNIFKLFCIFMTLLLNYSHTKILHTHKHHSHANQIMHFFASNAQSYVSFARLAYCQREVIQQMSCSFCNSLTSEYSTYFIHSVLKENNRLFQFVIVYSDLKREVIISFSGPTTDHGNYFTSIYSSGFITLPELGGVQVEREYWEIYSQHMREILIQKIHNFFLSNRSHYTVIFVGHSFGGSLATLSAYDLVTNNIIVKTHNSPLVYTYGPLRIGDPNFVNRVNSVVKVVKILRSDDWVTRMPNCVFLEGRYQCFNNFSQVTQRLPVLQNYINTCGILPPRFKSVDPIVRGTTFIGRQLYRTHTPMFYSQPFGTELIYNGPKFSSFHPCRYVNSVPICERNYSPPATFSPDVHRFYYNINLEQC